ncbi:MAG: hypothetical protein Q8867_06745 [Bacteroidota bacterium]|nr:hypothetical protein [Bacteroidota bacterium]
MKKTLAICICLLSFLSTGQAMMGKKEHKNKVKSTTTMQTVYENGKPSTYKVAYEEFDKNGNTLLYEEFSKEGGIVHKETFIFSSSDDLTQETFFDASSGKNYIKTHKYTLVRDKSRESEETTYNSKGEIVKKIVFTYTASGKKATETTYNATGNIQKKQVFRYNSKDLKTNRQSFSSTGDLENSKEWLYEYY